MSLSPFRLFSSTFLFGEHHPRWLQVISRLNPLTYEDDALRAFMLRNGTSTVGIGPDFVILTAIFAVLVIASRLYPRMGE